MVARTTERDQTQPTLHFLCRASVIQQAQGLQWCSSMRVMFIIRRDKSCPQENAIFLLMMIYARATMCNKSKLNLIGSQKNKVISVFNQAHRYSLVNIATRRIRLNCVKSLHINVIQFLTFGHLRDNVMKNMPFDVHNRITSVLKPKDYTSNNPSVKFILLRQTTCPCNILLLSMTPP